MPQDNSSSALQQKMASLKQALAESQAEVQALKQNNIALHTLNQELEQQVLT